MNNAIDIIFVVPAFKPKIVDSNIDFPRIGFEKGTIERGFSKVSKSV